MFRRLIENLGIRRLLSGPSADVHDRMPVIVKESDYTHWLDPKIHDRALLEDIMAPYPADLMEGWPVGTGVHNPKLDDESLIAPIGDDDQLVLPDEARQE